MLESDCRRGNFCIGARPAPGTPVRKVQPGEGMALTIPAGQPGPKLCTAGPADSFRLLFRDGREWRPLTPEL